VPNSKRAENDTATGTTALTGWGLLMDHDVAVQATGEKGWHLLADCGEFVKWQYSDSPYRVVADLDESSGHWRAIFTSWYPGPAYQIRGNCGGGSSGRMKAIAAAQKWMEDNATGCPPPGQYESGATA
jgi:hypothetical protein